MISILLMLSTGEVHLQSVFDFRVLRMKFWCLLILLLACQHEQLRCVSVSTIQVHDLYLYDFFHFPKDLYLVI